MSMGPRGLTITVIWLAKASLFTPHIALYGTTSSTAAPGNAISL
jgi:hypothetical protein